jgi:hypothetical protein
MIDLTPPQGPTPNLSLPVPLLETLALLLLILVALP